MMERYKLGDICEIVSGSTPKTNVKEYWGGDVKWITPAELNDEIYIITDSVRKITELGVKKTGLIPFPKGTVILSSRAPIGKVAIAGCEMYCNQGFKNLICSKQIDNRYLYWFLKGNTAFLQSLGRGATFKEISKKIVANIEINVPEKEIQKLVVNNLEKISKIIQLRKQELQKLDELIHARFVEMFGDAIQNDKRWESDTIENLCKNIYGGGTPSKSHPEYYENASIPWVSSKDMKTDVLDDSQIKINQLGIDNSTARMIPINSVIVVIRSGILKHTLPVAINTVPITINQDLKAFIPCKRILAIFMAIQFKMLEKDILSGVRTVTADNIEFNSLKRKEMIVPPIELQQQFSDFVQKVNKSKVVVQKALDETQLLFDSLMQKYFG